MVRVYAADISEFPDPLNNPDILGKLSEKRIQRVLNYKNALNRKQCAGAQLLFEEVLRINGIPKKEVFHSENGKPYTDGIFFNISHSHNMVICAIGECEVGCDIEKFSEKKTNESQFIFSNEELQYLKSLETKEKTNAFFRLWTIKESYMKFTGEGIKLPVHKISADIGNTVSLKDNGKKCSCNIKEYEIPGYCISVCAEEDVFCNSVEFIDISTNS